MNKKPYIIMSTHLGKVGSVINLTDLEVATLPYAAYLRSGKNEATQKQTKSVARATSLEKVK